jgi:hypothetical protein
MRSEKTKVSKSSTGITAIKIEPALRPLMPENKFSASAYDKWLNAVGQVAPELLWQARHRSK